MPFDDFYKESDQAARRWWKCVGLAFLLFIGYWVVALSLMSETDRNGIHPQVPTVSERMNRVDELCSQLPKPEEFYFVGKKFPDKNFRPVLVTYFFKTKRSEQEILPSFIVWLSANGWADNKDKNKVLEFSKNDQTISISPVYYPEANYSIECTDWSIE